MRGAHTPVPRTLASTLTAPRVVFPAEVTSLNVGANLNSYCQVTTCVYQNMDFGGWASPCGYAAMLRVTVNGANVTSAGVQTSLLPLTLTVTPRAHGQNSTGVAMNSFYATAYSMPSFVADGGSSYS